MYRAVHRISGEFVAVKVMDRERIKPTSIEREWTVLEHLGSSEHVVQFKAAYITQKSVSFVLEMCVAAAVCAVLRLLAVCRGLCCCCAAVAIAHAHRATHRCTAARCAHTSL